DLIAKEETEALVFLEARGAEAMACFDLLGSAFGKIRFVPAGVIEVHVMQKPSGKKLVGQRFVAFEFGRRVAFARDHAAAEIDSDSQSHRVHDAHRASEMFLRVINMLMQVDDAMFGAPRVSESVDA